MNKQLNKFGFRSWRRHSLVLVVAGLVYIGIGVSMFSWTSSPERNQALAVALNVAPFSFWAVVFIVCGLLATLSSRWPMLSELWGYSVLTGLSGGWAATYATGLLFERTTVQEITGVLVWGLVAFMWWSIAGLVNPDKTTVVVVVDNGST